jgi:Ca2+-binding RTX toxin-like protein
MAVHRFSALRDGQAIRFDPDADDLFFDQTAISAASVRVAQVGDDVRVGLASGPDAGKDIFLLDVDLDEISGDNVQFANGTRLVFGDDGDDILQGSGGRDHLAGFGGDDTYFVTAGDFLFDTGGVDTVVSPVDWNLGPGFENLVLVGNAVLGGGNSADNAITGNGRNNVLIGREGDDSMFGGAGNDTIIMSNGGGASYGNDYIEGGAGRDTLDFGNNARSPVFVDLSLGSASGGGSGGSGSAIVLDMENVNGGRFDDQLTGNDADNFFYGYLGNDWLDGGRGRDSLDGADGNDTLAGGEGNDTLLGGRGDDWLYGGFSFATAGEATGNDVLIGGPGRDSFVFNDNPNPFISSPAATADRITDFRSGTDTLVFDDNVFPGVGEPGRFDSGDERFFAARGATSGHDESDRVVYDTRTGNLYFDPDGIGGAEAQIIATLQGAPTVVASDIAVI